MVATDSIQLVWDLRNERPTLGGALVLRQEGEILAELRDNRVISVHLQGANLADPRIASLIENVFAYSKFKFIFAEKEGGEREADVWPTEIVRRSRGFSYFSFSRLLELYQKYQIKPRLSWNVAITDRAKNFRAKFGPQLICLHLRFVAPYRIDESNADGSVWNEFLRAAVVPGEREFLLLGHDELPSGFALVPGISRAVDLGIGLASQLALASQSDGFIGTASGVCTAVNLSETPHVIFKHPAHHSEEMRNELGEQNRFPFGNVNQQLWRRVVTQNLLQEALAVVAK